MKQRLGFILAFGAALLLSACGSVRIAQIQSNPFRYQNRSVSVTGNVVNSIGLLGAGGYQLDDGTGRIYVISTSGIPARGAHVTVRGRVSSAAQVMGRSIGTAIHAESQKVRR
jgi:hypothetical protein